MRGEGEEHAGRRHDTWVVARAAAGRREAFSYRLASGREGTIHIEPVLEYNWDPGSMQSRLLDKLTLEALGRRSRRFRFPSRVP